MDDYFHELPDAEQKKQNGFEHQNKKTAEEEYNDLTVPVLVFIGLLAAILSTVVYINRDTPIGRYISDFPTVVFQGIKDAGSKTVKKTKSLLFDAKIKWHTTDYVEL